MWKYNLDLWSPRFLNKEQVEYIEKNFWSPCFVYSENEWEKVANEFLDFPNAYGLQVKYAMKSFPNKNILKFYSNKWIWVDASSEFEVYRAIDAWVPAKTISLVTQELPRDLNRILESWIFYIASSLYQLEEVAKTGKRSEMWVRINIGLWSGYNPQNSTGWANSSFGIWYKDIPKILEIEKKYNIKISLIHIHIGSGNSVDSWLDAADSWLNIVEKFKNTKTLDLWWGFKIGLTPLEKVPNLQDIWNEVKSKFEDFYKKTGRKIKLAVEPWKYLSANTWSFVTKIIDIIKTTWEWWKKFIKLNSWMNDMPRVAMYWVQESIYIMNKEKEKENYVVVWHCCESWDIKTVKLYESWTPELRRLNKANIWDLVVVDWTGWYNSWMAMKNYNSFPESAELLLRKDWSIVEIRKREWIKEIWRNEISVI